MSQSNPDIQAVGEQISVAAQPSPAQIEQLPQQGFKSVVNLRSYQEESATEADQQRVESLGLAYENLPIKPAELTEEQINQVIDRIHELPKPLLVYCGSSLRATFISLLYIATHHGLTLAAAKAKGKELGFDFDSKPQLAQWLQHYTQAQNPSEE